jgi:hypothetical protein
MLDPVLVDMGEEEPAVLHRRNDFRARVETVEPEVFFGHEAVGGLDDLRLGIEHVEHLGRLDPCALADFEVVEIVSRRDLDRARAQFGIGVLVRHHRIRRPVSGCSIKAPMTDL